MRIPFVICASGALFLSSAFCHLRASDAVAVLQPRVRPQAKDTRDVLKVDSSMVLIPAHVTLEDGTPVGGLSRSNFHIFENGVEQPITYFAEDDAPVSITLLFDVSGSMRTKMGTAASAAAAFFRTSNAQDEFSLIEFGDRAKLRVPFTGDIDDVAEQIAKTRPFGRTALFDAVHLALKNMKRAVNSRKALLVLSDGGDNWSWHTARGIRNELLESDVLVYAMGIFDPEENRKSSEEQNGPQLLDELAEQSGGRDYRVDDLRNLPAISAKIGNQLRNEYLIGFHPNLSARDGKYHPVILKVNASPGAGKLRTSYRHGYFEPSE